MSIHETITEISAGSITEIPVQKSPVDLVEQHESYVLPIDEEVRRINEYHALRARQRRLDLLRPVSEGSNIKERTRLITYQGFFPIDYH